MAVLGRVDEVVVGAVEPFYHRFKARHIPVAQLARRQTLARRGLLHLLSVLVGAGKKIYIVAIKPHEARNGIGRDCLVGVADMRRPVRIGNRDRKSTRLNSSHPSISYAVFCLKKKKRKKKKLQT